MQRFDVSRCLLSYVNVYYAVFKGLEKKYVGMCTLGVGRGNAVDPWFPVDLVKSIAAGGYKGVLAVAVSSVD